MKNTVFLSLLFSLVHAISAYGVLSPTTKFGDISPTNTIHDIVDASGASGNAVDVVTKTNVDSFVSVDSGSIVGNIRAATNLANAVNAMSNTVYNKETYFDVSRNVLSLIDKGEKIWTSSESSCLTEDVLIKTNISTFVGVETNSIVGTINTISNDVYNSKNYLDVSNNVLSVIKNDETIWSSKGFSTTGETAIIAKNSALAMKPVKICNYLWEVGTENEDYEKALERYKQVYPSYRGGCTGVAVGKYQGRNYDWYYDKCCTFVIHSAASDNKYASIGIAGGIKSLTQEKVASGEWSDGYYALPFSYVDGMNEKGVVIQCNVVPTNSASATSVWRTRTNGIILFAIIRKALDTSESAEVAANFIKNNIFIPAEFNYDTHYLVSDRTSKFIVEDNQVIPVDNAKNVPIDILSNFRMYSNGIIFNEGKPDWNTVEEYGNGLERYEAVRDNIGKCTSIDGMIETMKEVWFTKAYTQTVGENTRLTDYCGDEATMGYPNLTVQNTTNSPSMFNNVVANEYTIYTSEHEGPNYRGGHTWQTVHTAIYDKENLTVTLLTQEDADSKNVFFINGYVKNSVTQNELVEYCDISKPLFTTENVYTDDLNRKITERGVVVGVNATVIDATEAGKPSPRQNVTIGRNSKTDTASVAVGSGSEAVNTHEIIPYNMVGPSLAIGYQAKARASKSIAIGSGSDSSRIGPEASQYGAIAIGTSFYKSDGKGGSTNVGVKASGLSSIAIGSAAYDYSATDAGINNIGTTEACGIQSIALGFGTTASNTASVAIGSRAIAEADGAIQLGAGHNVSSNTLAFRHCNLFTEIGSGTPNSPYKASISEDVDLTDNITTVLNNTQYPVISYSDDKTIANSFKYNHLLYTFTLPPSVTNINWNLETGSGAISPNVYFRSTPLLYVKMPNVKSVTETSFVSMFNRCESLQKILFPELEIISGSNAMFGMCRSCVDLKEIDFSKLTKLNGNSCFNYTFSGCTSLSTVSFPKLTYISGNAMNEAFENCTSIVTFYMNSIESITGGRAIRLLLWNCTSLQTVEMRKLNTTNYSATEKAFAGCTKLSNVYLDSLDADDLIEIGCFGAPQTSKITFHCLGGTNVVYRDKSWIKVNP